MSGRKITNAYSAFVYNFIDDEKRKGRQVSTAAAFSEAGPLWQQLTDQEKGFWKTQAKTAKRSQVPAASKNVTDPKMINTAKIAELKEVKCLINAYKNFNTLNTQKFYIMHTNYFCTTPDNKYLPAEVAFVSFSLEGGVSKSIHRLLDPGSLPLGTRREAMLISESTHQIELPPYLHDDDKFYDLFYEIYEIIQEGSECGMLPPIFCPSDNVEICKSLLEQAFKSREEHYGYEEAIDVDSIKLYEVDKLLFHLKNYLIEREEESDYGNPLEVPKFQALVTAASEMKKLFCYNSLLSCDYHSTKVNHEHFCSKSIALRNIYILLDHCCEVANIKMIPAKHFCVNVDALMLERHLTNCFSECARPQRHEESDEEYSPVNVTKMEPRPQTLGSRGRGLFIGRQADVDSDDNEHEHERERESVPVPLNFGRGRRFLP